MDLIDTHSHIYLREFEGEFSEVVERALSEGVSRILMPAVDSTTHGKLFELAGKFSSCLPMMGLHPCSVSSNFEQELVKVGEYLRQGGFTGVGEIGLDFYWDKTFEQEQVIAFRRQLSWAREFDLPVSIHSRNATDACLGVVDEFRGVRGVFHCFSGDVTQAWRAIDAGFYLGIGGVITFKNSGLDGLIKEVDLKYMVLETDAPYLAPMPFRGKRNEPAYLKYVAERIGLLKNMEVDAVAEVTTENAKKLFGLTSKQ